MATQNLLCRRDGNARWALLGPNQLMVLCHLINCCLKVSLFGIDDSFGFSNRMKRNFSTDHIPNDCMHVLSSNCLSPKPLFLKTFIRVRTSRWATTTCHNSSSLVANRMAQLAICCIMVKFLVWIRPQLRCHPRKCPFDLIRTISSMRQVQTCPTILTTRISALHLWRGQHLSHFKTSQFLQRSPPLLPEGVNLRFIAVYYT